MTRKRIATSFVLFVVIWMLWTIIGWHYMSIGAIRIQTGMYTVDSLLEGSIFKLVQSLRYLLLPALTLGIVLSGVFLRLTRSNMFETLRLDFVTAARARGLKESTVTYTYALRNAFLPD
jgi:peptide/nickel transport system permease protein